MHTPTSESSGVEWATEAWPTAHFDVQNTGHAPDGADVTGCLRTQWRDGTETGDEHVGTGGAQSSQTGRSITSVATGASTPALPQRATPSGRPNCAASEVGQFRAHAASTGDVLEVGPGEPPRLGGDGCELVVGEV